MALAVDRPAGVVSPRYPTRPRPVVAPVGRGQAFIPRAIRIPSDHAPGSSAATGDAGGGLGLLQYLPSLPWSRTAPAGSNSRTTSTQSRATAFADAPSLLFPQPRLQQRQPQQPQHQQQQQQQQQRRNRPDPEPELHPVLDLIQARLADGSRPGQRRDGHKLGLVVEGGGMRGIVTGAMLMTLLELGVRDVFDVIYGASAGAINSTFYLSGQHQGLDIYTDYLATDPRFLSLKRYWSRSPVMDLGFLLDEVMTKITPLDWEAVLGSPLPLKVVASSLTTLQAEAFGGFACREDLVECLKASANVPEIVGPPRQHRGHRLVDAAVFEPIPVKTALRERCSHVLALCSRPPDAGPAWGRLLRRAVHNAVKYTVLNPPYMREAWRVEPLHTTHQGQPLDDLLAELHLQRATLSLDLSTSPGGSGSATPSGSSSDSDSGDRGGVSDRSVSGRGRAQGITAADGEAGHVLPVYPGPAAAFAPVCTNVDVLLAGRAEGHAAMRELMLPVLPR